MDAATLLLFNAAILGALASPGPAFIAMIRSSFVGGRRAGLMTGLGLSLAAIAWSAVAMLGLSAIFAAIPAAYMALKLAGAGYLIWLAVQLWRGADKPVDTVLPGIAQGFRLGLITNLANPKLVFFIGAIFSTILPADMDLSLQALILANHLLLELAWYAMAALILTTAPMRAGYIRLKSKFDRGAAVLLGVMAARIAI
ncbi:LysE family translocator [Roseovarius sp. Pro17]|uniref:LysE family translocator n=1 Tax=Roseovarius sp. Pro17 TaxID=3108175 RepID=UPI002D7821A4|nr:LysE family transporter [Roseovarius sp. Pro17]